MDTGSTWVERMRLRLARWLVKGPASPLIVTGTLALATLGGAALSAGPGHAQPVPQNVIAPTDQTAPAYPAGCYADPDGDGTIKCDGSMSISSLPASLGHCWTDQDFDSSSLIICDGNSR